MWFLFQGTTASQSNSAFRKSKPAANIRSLQAVKPTHTYPAFLSGHHRQQCATVHLSHQQFRDTEETKNISAFSERNMLGQNVTLEGKLSQPAIEL